ncbi:MAG: hypothetical protein U0V04_01010 [Spirosomataceae bacterium]
MKPFKTGQIVKFHTPLPDEDSSQIFVTTSIAIDVDKPRADIKALRTGNSFVPINTVLIDDLILVEMDNSDLIGHMVTIKKSDFSIAKGIVVKINEQENLLDLTKVGNGVETNLMLTILDQNGTEHSGSLFVI